MTKKPTEYVFKSRWVFLAHIVGPMFITFLIGYVVGVLVH